MRRTASAPVGAWGGARCALLALLWLAGCNDGASAPSFRTTTAPRNAAALGVPDPNALRLSARPGPPGAAQVTWSAAATDDIDAYLIDVLVPYESEPRRIVVPASGNSVSVGGLPAGSTVSVSITIRSRGGADSPSSAPVPVRVADRP